MHPERDPYTSYRVEVVWPPGEDALTYLVTIYPPIAGGSVTPTIGAAYREDVIPEWMQVAIDMLNMAAVNGDATIHFFGSKAGNVYWLHAQQTYEGRREK